MLCTGLEDAVDGSKGTSPVGLSAGHDDTTAGLGRSILVTGTFGCAPEDNLTYGVYLVNDVCFDGRRHILSALSTNVLSLNSTTYNKYRILAKLYVAEGVTVVYPCASNVTQEYTYWFFYYDLYRKCTYCALWCNFLQEIAVLRMHGRITSAVTF